MHVTFPAKAINGNGKAITNGKGKAIGNARGKAINRRKGRTNKTRAMAEASLGFNYDGVPGAIALQLKECASEIRNLRKSAVASMLQIGRLLADARRTLSTPTFKGWLAAELHITYASANNYIRAASVFPDLAPAVAANFDPTALIILTRQRVAHATREQAVALAEAGTTITLSKAVALMDENRGPEQPAQLELERLYRLRWAVRRAARDWTGARLDLVRQILQVVRDVLTEGAEGGEVEGAATAELEATAAALGVPMIA